MKNRICIAVTALLMALAFILPVQAAGTQGQATAHAHGPHTNPQGKLVGNGDPSLNTSWWWREPTSSTVYDWGGTQASTDWPTGILYQTGTLKLNGWSQTQSCANVCNLNLTSPVFSIQPGVSYDMEWHMTASLGGGWTWGQPSTTDCYLPNPSTMQCDYVTIQILIPLVATPTATPQATNTPVPPTNTPQATATAANCQLGITAVYTIGGGEALVQINTSPVADDYTVFISWQPATMVGPQRFPGVGNGEFLTVFVGGTGSFRFSIEGTDTTTGTTCSGGTTGPVQII